jgi:hypothetical protein
MSQDGSDDNADPHAGCEYPTGEDTEYRTLPGSTVQQYRTRIWHATINCLNPAMNVDKHYGDWSEWKNVGS